MAFWKKIFTKEEKSESPRKGATQEPVPTAGDQAVEIAQAKKPVVGSARGVITIPHTTEKASDLARADQYVFRVPDKANKIQIKQAVSARYGVAVEGVRVMNMASKERRRGQQIGWKPGFKKAIVQLKKGSAIEIQ